MYLLFDIGGTKMRFALSSDGLSLSEPEILDTPQGFDDAIALIEKVSNRLCQDEKIEAVAGGIAGTFNPERTQLTNSPHLSGWVGRDIKQLFAKTVDCPVFVENDTALVGLGEAVAGAGQGHAIVAYITVSTGVGGARIVNGQIDQTAVGFEPGHQIVDMDHWDKHLEDYISGTAVKAETGQEPKAIHDPEYWRQKAEILAAGLHNTILHWSPEVVVLGGSMFKDPGIKIEDVQASLTKISSIFGKNPELIRATLGDIGGLYGALAFVRQKIGA